MEFKKKVIQIDNEGMAIAEAVAEEKINLLRAGIQEAEQHIKVDDYKAFSEDFITYTTDKIVTKNKRLKSLNLSNDKILNLLDINLNSLYKIQVEFEENNTKLYFDKNAKPYTKVDKEPFIKYTKNVEQNKRLEAIQNLLISLEGMEEFYHIYKGNVAPMTSNAVIYDLRKNEYRINPLFFK